MLQSRQELSDDDIYSKFYTNVDISKMEVSKLWHKIAEILHINPGQLRPDDCFEDLLYLPKWLSGYLIDATDIDVLEYWAGTIKRHKCCTHAPTINTIEELMKYLMHSDD